MRRASMLAALGCLMALQMVVFAKAEKPVPLAAAPPATAPSLPGPRPYYGQALGGAVYYNWGYFGAKQHAQTSRYRGYDGRWHQCLHSKGY